MFTREQKHAISEAIQRLLRATGHPALPEGEIQFKLHVRGVTAAHYANIVNNGDVPPPTGQEPGGLETGLGWHL